MYSSKKKVVIIVMCVMMILMAIGYAVLSTNLNIKGTSNLTGTWGIRIDSITSTATGRAYNITDPTYTDTNMTFNVGVKEPGDKMTFEVVLKNYGSIGAILDDIEASSSGSPSINYSISGIKKGDKLSGYASTTLTIVTEFDINATELPTATNKTLNIKLSFIQDDGQTITGDDPTIDEKVVKVYGKPDTIGTEMQIGNEKFYVISSNSTKVVALAKYGLDIVTADPNATYKGTGRQDKKILTYSEDGVLYGTLAFTSDDFSACSSYCTSYPCDAFNSCSATYTPVMNYKTYLESLGAQISKARLITYDELINLGCTGDVDNSGNCSNAPFWTHDISYWTGTSGSEYRVWAVSAPYNMFVNDDYDDNPSAPGTTYGIRPVIEVLKSNIDYIDLKPKANGNITKVGTDIQIGDEHFYVIYSDSSKVVALAKYNLDINNALHVYKGTGIQDEHVRGADSDSTTTDYGTIAFSTTNYWTSTCSSYPCYVYNNNSNLYTHVEAYKSYLKNLGVSVTNARLIKAEELTALGCTITGGYMNCQNSSYNWIYETAYWAGTAAESTLLINSNRIGNSIVGSYTHTNYLGVRPIIEIPRSEFS